MHSQQSGMEKVLFGVYKPHEGCCVEDVVAHMVWMAASIEKCTSNNINITIIKSICEN